MSPEERQALFANVVGVVRGSSALAAQDIDFYKSLDKNINESVSDVTSDLVSMINSVLSSIDEHCEPLDNDKESFKNSWSDMGNIIDNLFEKSDRSLDILNKRLSVSGDKLNGPNMQFLDQFGGNEEGGKVKIEKPQLNFKTPIDNSESHPFHPLLKEKPNALIPLEESIILVPAKEDEPEHYIHPYEYEIDHQEYNQNILKIEEPIPSTNWDETDAVWVDNVETLQQMISELKHFKELAVDLEHHDYRSYYGIVCLMQISTREKDYLVDTLSLREELHILNEIFTDPQVTKVLHGAFMDIIWLQRDLGLYIVSLFDTFHASKAMGLPRHSLAYLLEKFAHFKTSKKYQLSDWRTRPLSKGKTAYARADTHFLLNIFDQVKNKLIESSKLAGVLKDSREVAKRRFEYSKFRPTHFSNTVYSVTSDQYPWKNIMFKYNIPKDKELLVKELYNWRDLIARRDDESPRYVMPNQIIASLVAYTPTDAVGVVSVNNMVTDYVRSNSKILANMIKDCLVKMKEQGSILSEGNISVSDKVNYNNNDSNNVNKVSTSQIQSWNCIFDTLVNDINTVTPKVASITDELLTTSKYFGELLNDKVIKYGEQDNGEKSVVSNNELEERRSEYKKQLSQLEDIDLEIPVTKIEPTVELRSEISEEKPNEVSVEKMEETLTPSEDLDEIIVLRKVRRDNNKSSGTKDRNINDDELETVDYSKSAKLLSNDTTKRKRKNTKRKFDPFSSIQEGPKGIKKRKAGTRGKNVSFKR
ncbi:similar to Saccharomyces cerevisiae YOR001W RRP6 Nuclear exosome exonuclease component [Maudiozyma barnettii]|uniref:Similar to Saccharomyces cerevisiae YOR001W RRP6 Nuclear exosome exonuclease component n=1 Tax=Maudiozyma barnettii TaxID=61262 RepID=A0A8H2VHB7_9SACH|nr:exosome nuclease subunit RRP6 [Kazachstania barnettii]CAB4255560.1 similar to Saccharomyces cerevisiae YOR001W RRP6 Nuclear exosome exonuclease component [Kazachstania barnettii]CAD1784058.1 similar to Saccharomyces cerevisiae YOR001W RRP6 Nuclear exosome exonuclease component [Kazachstania barnettii]